MAASVPEQLDMLEMFDSVQAPSPSVIPVSVISIAPPAKVVQNGLIMYRIASYPAFPTPRFSILQMIKAWGDKPGNEATLRTYLQLKVFPEPLSMCVAVSMNNDYTTFFYRN